MHSIFHAVLQILHSMNRILRALHWLRQKLCCNLWNMHSISHTVRISRPNGAGMVQDCAGKGVLTHTAPPCPSHHLQPTTCYFKALFFSCLSDKKC